MNDYLVFDIETGALPEAECLQFAPEFSAPANYKDPEKIKASIEEQRAKWLADGALSAITGKVLAIGLLNSPNLTIFAADESPMLVEFWRLASEHLYRGGKLIGFYCKTFDLPFLVRRSMKHRVKVPAAIFQGRWFSDQIIDVAELWSCGNRDPRDRISLDTLSRYLGIGAKTGKGEDFAQLLAKDRDKALDYLRNDLRLTLGAFQATQGLNPTSEQ